MELAYKLTEVSSSYSSRRCQAGQPWDEPCPVPTLFCCFQDTRHTLDSFPRLAAWGRVHVLLVTAMGRAGLGQGGAEYVGTSSSAVARGGKIFPQQISWPAFECKVMQRRNQGILVILVVMSGMVRAGILHIL